MPPVLAQSLLPYNVTPPAPYAVPVVQPDGTTLHLIARGNPWQPWSETTDGYTVVKTPAGYYEYATEQQGSLIGSGRPAQDPERRTLLDQRRLLSLNKHQRPVLDVEQKKALRQQLSPFRNARTVARGTMPSQGKINVLAICIEYPDLPHTRTVDSFFNMFNGPSAKPTFKQFFLDNSYGKLDMSVDVVGWVQAKENYANYGHSGGYAASHDLVAEAIDAAEDKGVDFSKYDNNNDGKVDGVVVIHSGPGAEEGSRSEYIWSHRWAINSRYYDQRNISDYTIQPETRYGGPVGIGIFCHEFGHLLGLPDLYDTNFGDGKSNGIGEWGLMGTGGWLGSEDYPAGMTAWSKETLGWAEIRDITDEYGAYDLRAASQHNEFYKVRTPHENEYFLLENRQRQGVDRSLSGSGLAIWHIDQNRASSYPASNSVNGDVRRKGVDLEEADGRNDLDNSSNRSDAGDLFPGTAGQMSFDYSTKPSSAMYVSVSGSTESGLKLENIRETDGRIAFSYRKDGDVGGACSDPATATAGKNQAEQPTAWYEFTLPKDGGIALEYSGKNAQIAVYTACDGQPVAESATGNLAVGYLRRGQKVLIKWEFSGQPKLPLTWDLRIEDSVTAKDSLALVSIYQRTAGPSWTKKRNWLTGPVASWEGVKIKDGRVTELQLENAGLRNSLPTELYQLTALRKLTILEENLGGTLSNELTKLNELEELSVEVPGLSVSFLPEINKLKQLKKLRLVSVAANQAIPGAIGQLTNLEELVLRNAKVTGRVPEALGQCLALTRIDLSENQLEGAVPARLFNLPNLTFVALRDNRLESLPTNVLAAGKLRECYLQNNRLQNSLPRDVDRPSATPLTLALDNNQFNGSVPEAWATITFDELTLSNNQLTGELPALGMPVRLDISNNRFTKLPTLTKTSFSRGKTCVLVCHSNQLTFDDLMPNREYLNCPNCQDRYAPQADVRLSLDRNLKSGESTTLTLPLDEGVAENRYTWYRQNQAVSETNDNALTVSSFSANQAGAYRVDITNAAFPGLTISVAGIRLNFQEKQLPTLTVPTLANKQFGDAPFTINSQSSAGLPVEYRKVSGPIVLDGNRVTIRGAGEAVIKVVSPGNDTYAAVEQEITFTIARATPVIEVTEVGDKMFGDDPFQLAIRATNDLSVSLTVEVGNVTLDNRWVQINGTGNVRIRASRRGDQDYEAAEPVLIEFDVNRAAQSLTFAEVADTTYVPNGVIPLATNLSSDLDVQYEVVSGGVTIDDGRAIMKEAGSVTIRAFRNGNENYTPADPVTRSFTIAKAPQQIYFPRIDDKFATDNPFAPEASSSANQPVRFRIRRGPATITAEGLLSLTGAGEVTVEAYQEGSVNYEAADPVSQSFLVRAANKENQRLTVTGVPDTVLVGETLTLTINSSSGLSPKVQVAGPVTLADTVTLAVESLGDNYYQATTTFGQEGTVAVLVAQAGDDTYNAAATFKKTITVLTDLPPVRPLAQSLVFGPADRQYGDSVDVQTSSSLPVSLEVLEGPARITEDGWVKMTGLGTVRVKTTQEGSDRYAAIDTVIEFTVSPAAQAIRFEATQLNDSTYLLQGSVTSGLPVAYTVQSGEAVLLADTLRVRGGEEVVVVATQGGSEFYQAAEPQSKTFAPEVITSVEEVSPVVLRIYPNPSSAVFRIELAPDVTAAEYRVFNTQGQQLLRGTIRPADAILDLGHIATGTYVLSLQTDQSSTRHRLIRQ